MSNKKEPKNNLSDEINNIDISIIDFSFLEDDEKLKWIDTSKKKHDNIRIKTKNNLPLLYPIKKNTHNFNKKYYL